MCDQGMDALGLPADARVPAGRLRRLRPRPGRPTRACRPCEMQLDAALARPCARTARLSSTSLSTRGSSARRLREIAAASQLAAAARRGLTFPAHSCGPALRRETPMEANTFTTTVYARTPAARAFAYLRRLQNLDEWTLGSRMMHAHRRRHLHGHGVGLPDDAVLPRAHARARRVRGDRVAMRLPLARLLQAIPGVRVPVAVCGPGRRRGRQLHPLDQRDRSGPPHRDDHAGIAAVHHYEGRGLKAALERREGIAQPARRAIVRALGHDVGRCADRNGSRAVLADRRPSPLWAPLFRPSHAAAATFVDEYARRVHVEFTAMRAGRLRAGRAGLRLSRSRVRQRCPIVLVPCVARVLFWPHQSGMRGEGGCVLPHVLTRRIAGNGRDHIQQDHLRHNE